jgi:predicted glutamine amidotransferase
MPNPHPFEHEGMLFAHNGVISEEMLSELLLADDRNYLGTCTPDYVHGYIDSSCTSFIS